MIDIELSRTYQGTKTELFGYIDTVHKLAAVKAAIRPFRTARDEAGLQIIDTAIPVLLFRLSTRLRYTTNPDKYGELEQIKGSFSSYLCRYTLEGSASSITLRARLVIRYPLGPIGFIMGIIFRPLEKFRLGRELARLETRLRSARQ